jgi:hypothetical protein
LVVEAEVVRNLLTGKTVKLVVLEVVHHKITDMVAPILVVVQPKQRNLHLLDMVTLAVQVAHHITFIHKHQAVVAQALLVGLLELVVLGLLVV